VRISEQWLRDWVDVDADTGAIAEQLTMAGLEVDDIEPAAPDLGGVIIGAVAACQSHPEADTLQICAVDTGSQRLQIVCGAPNVTVGARVPVATIGSRLPNGMEITTANLRGVASAGMLCSPVELGLGTDADGLLLLPGDAPVGQPLAEYLDADDKVLEIELTPNRGDCLSMRGVAREVAVAFDTALAAPAEILPEVADTGQPDIAIQADDLCSTYAGRYVSGIDSNAQSPIWMRERLRRAGMRPLHPAVDVGNYVMMDIGQPLHAFDADKLAGGIQVRRAAAGESIVTLDGQHVVLEAGTLVIADDEGPVAIAGVIGGQRTASDENTRNVLYESACFTQAAVAGTGRRYKIHTDALHRFERGVDPDLYRPALERASALLTAIAGGTCGPVGLAEGQPVWPGDRSIRLRGAQITRLLGQAIPPDFIATALRGLGASCECAGANQWRVVPPSWRYDLVLEADLIEEIARLYGYDRLLAEPAGVALPAARSDIAFAEGGAPDEVLRQRGYDEAITYSFVAPELHAELTGNAPTLPLDNPISDQMTEMRRTLWAGLLEAWQYNARRQQARVRLFEQGLRFQPERSAAHGIAQIDTVAGLAAGTAEPPHWDTTARPVDFFAVRGDIEALLAGVDGKLTFRAETHPALHPGRSARIYLAGRPIGWVGQLVPALSHRFKGLTLPYLFELDREALASPRQIRYAPLSDQPRIARDIALIVAHDVAAGDLIETVEGLGNTLIQSVNVFDVFSGEEIGAGYKSVALNLIFQDKTSTLDDHTVDRIVADVLDALRIHCGARIRGK
jgi:phenylalanyl-tRNA synthetase beta chain